MGLFMFRFKAALLLLTALSLAGCDVTSGDGPGPVARAFSGTSTSIKSAIGLSGDSASTAVNNAAMGGLIGAKLGPLLNEDDRKLAYAAELAALNNGAPGAPVPWKNPVSGRYGNIVPGPVYDQKGRQCRGFSHTITVSGELSTARGTACRSPEGNWAAVG
jgi:surface antigen